MLILLLVTASFSFFYSRSFKNEPFLLLGMDGVDKEKVQRIVYEMSKGSKYFENEERKEAFIRQKIEDMRARCAKLSATDVSHYQKVLDF